MTTTDTGETVPFIVRAETGVLARDEYRIAALANPKANPPAMGSSGRHQLQAP